MMYFNKLKHKLIVAFRHEIGCIVSNIIREEELKRDILYRNERGVIDSMERTPLCISLTTYSKRIFDVALVVESLLHQTYKPNKIVLWLDEEEFNIESVPILLKKQIERGLEIKFCENLRSFKKIIPTLINYPEYNIITVDDDVLYPEDFVEQLMNQFDKEQRCIYYFRGRFVGKTRKGYLPYSKWKMVSDTEEHMDVLPTGIGGVLYPKGCFDERVVDSNLFMKLCPKADDIWLRVMTYLKGYPCKKVDMPGTFRENFVEISRGQDIALSKNNFFENTNDEQLKNVLDYFNLNL